MPNAYLINPFNKTVTPVVLTDLEKNWQQVYDLCQCQLVDIVRIHRNGDSIMVDDEGHITNKLQAYFRHEGYDCPLAGMGLYIGTNKVDGDVANPVCSIEQVRGAITWVEPGSFELPPTTITTFY